MSNGLAKIKIAALKTSKIEREINSLQSEQIGKLEEQINSLVNANKIQFEFNKLLVKNLQELEDEIKILKEKDE